MSTRKNSIHSLIVYRKSENEDLKKEVEKLKTSNSVRAYRTVPESRHTNKCQKLGSNLEAYSENLVLTAQLAQAKSTQRSELPFYLCLSGLTGI